MSTELQALQHTGTWEVVPLPPDVVPIICKWVYKVKTKVDGSIERYKARLVAQGFQQSYGCDYEETFAPVAHTTIVYTLIDVAAIHSWTISQMDVKNAFLHGDLKEEVICTHRQGLRFHLAMFAISGVLFMASSKHPELGFSGSIRLLLLQV
jgi:hypothetical protein